MKSLVVMTYYQLMHSIALALTFEEKPNLYFSMAYLNPDQSFLDRISNTGIFNEVVAINARGEYGQFIRKLKRTKNYSKEEIDQIGISLFEEYLVPGFKEDFKDADKEDEIFIYNDFQWYYYYIEKTFDKIIGVEDGYCSLLQQTRLHRYKGDYKHIRKFIDRGYHPQPLYRSDKIQKIISSAYFDELDDYYKSKLEIRDFSDIVKENADVYKSILLNIFNLEDFEIADNSVLYLEQPLDRAKYCNSIQSYLLNKKYLLEEKNKGYKVYVKPHPAEFIDCRVYEFGDIIVLPKDFPVEILNYQNQKFEELISFGSTGSMTTTCAKETISFYNGNGDIKDIKRFIRNEVKDEALLIDVFVRASELSPTDYINIYSAIFRNKEIRTRIHIVVPFSLEKEAIEYFDQSNMVNIIKEYKSEKKNTKKQAQWHDELRWMKNWIERYHVKVDICPCSDYEDDWVVYKEIISNYKDSDYVMLIDECNTLFNITEAIIKELKFRLKPAIFFKSFSNVTKSKLSNFRIAVKPGYVGKYIGGVFRNKLWHRAILGRIDMDDLNELAFQRIVNDFSDSLTRKFSGSLFIAPDLYSRIDDGFEYYGNIVMKLAVQYSNEREYLSGCLANIVYDYYNWREITGKNGDITIDNFVDKWIKDSDLKCDVYRLIANGLFYEKKKSSKFIMWQEQEFYYSIKSMVDKCAKSGSLTRSNDISKVKHKIFKRKKKKTIVNS